MVRISAILFYQKDDLLFSFILQLLYTMVRIGVDVEFGSTRSPNTVQAYLVIELTEIRGRKVRVSFTIPQEIETDTRKGGSL